MKKHDEDFNQENYEAHKEAHKGKRLNKAKNFFVDALREKGVTEGADDLTDEDLEFIAKKLGI